MTLTITTKNGDKYIYENVETMKTERVRGNGDWIVITGANLIEHSFYTDPFPGSHTNIMTDTMKKQKDFYIGYDPKKETIAIW